MGLLNKSLAHPQTAKARRASVGGAARAAAGAAGAQSASGAGQSTVTTDESRQSSGGAGGRDNNIIVNRRSNVRVKRGGIAAERMPYGRCVLMFTVQARGFSPSGPTRPGFTSRTASSSAPHSIRRSRSAPTSVLTALQIITRVMSERSRIRPSVPQPRRICQHAPRWPIPPRYRHDAGRARHDAGHAHDDAGRAHTEREHTTANAPLAARRRDPPSQL